MQILLPAPLPLVRRILFSRISLLVLLLTIPASAKPPKIHTVTLGPVRKVPYTPPQATPDTKSEDSSTLRINDSLPAEPVRWAWQPGPWLMVDRISGHITALHLPDFDPLVSDVVWFRDDAAYCGIASTAKSGIVAIITQLGSRKPIVQKLLAPWPQVAASNPICAAAIWQRTPMRATLQLTGAQPITYDVLGSVSLIEDNDNADD